MSYRRPRGTYDVYPGGREPHERPELWRWAEETAREFFRRYDYAEVRVPVFEETEVFVRSSGEASDIVRKEMFTFGDEGELALRPEGTAGVVRSYIEHSLFKQAQPLKLFYVGPMFRRERQQKGRYRQHTQVGAEVLGSADPLVDAEVMALLHGFHHALGVREEVFYVNNLGDAKSRASYVPELRAYLEKHRADLDRDSVERLQTNPLRILDSKDEGTRAVLEEAPSIRDFLSPEAVGHFAAVREGLEALGVPHEVDERLVRGLDYYTSVVFEAKSRVLGAQDTVGAGGRYNSLVADLGGPDVPGIGFGTGVERILLAAEAPGEKPSLDVFFVTLTPEARLPALKLAGALREAGISCDLDYAERSAKGQFKQADRRGASWVAVIGVDELRDGTCKLQSMSADEEKFVSIADGAGELLQAIGA